MRRALLFTVTTLLLAPGAMALDAQGPPQKFTNLKVFPPDTTPPVLVAAMKNFTRALGVRCPYCHVGEEGMPLEKFDFASDVKPQKQVARGMMQLAAEINGRITKAMPDAPEKGYQVTCWTCHRGSTHPQHTPDAPKPPGR
jgi:hypothetical protein